MSRTRLIRPEFYKDELMAGAAITTRFVYIGLWTLCDDAGYFERKPRQIAAELFPYDSQIRRQRVVDKALDELVELERVKYLDCGLHGVVPTLPKHGAKGGTKAETVASRHRTTCVRTNGVGVRTGGVRPSPDESSSGSGSGIGSDSVSENAQARDDEPVSFAERMAKAGIKTELTGRPA
jgi:hypothetical protein